MGTLQRQPHLKTFDARSSGPQGRSSTAPLSIDHYHEEKIMTAPSNLVGSQPKCLEITKIFDLLIIIYYYYDKSILPQFILGLEVLADDGIKPSQSTGHLIFLISSFSHPIKYFIFMPFNNTCNISSLKHLIN